MNSIGFTTNGQLSINGVPRSFSSHNAYNLISGGMSLTNSVITAGMATTLYTGNGATQSVVTGVDMATQWGNAITETFGGLVWLKSRSAIADNIICDTINGAGISISSNNTAIQQNNTASFTSITNTGFNISGTLAAFNTNLATYTSWNFQTTHRITGTTNHGKAYTCHYNPFTGFTMVKYEGSGLAGHEIPHHLGRKLGFATVKNLSAVTNWLAVYKESSYMQLNSTNAEAGYACALSDVSVSTSENTSTNQYIMYGWANSYFDVQNNLIGNYEVGIYQGTGVTGLKVTTKGKPAWVMVKRLDTTGSWVIQDNQRLDKDLLADSSAIENSVDRFDIGIDGFVLKSIDGGTNAAGGQYLYMVVYDNDSGSGKSKYNKATDTSALSLTATVPFANGIDANGTKNTILTFNETLSGLTYQLGKNYVYKDNLGNAGVAYHKWKVGNEFNGFGDYFDVNTNKWYQSPSVFSDTMDTATNWATGGATISSIGGKLVAVVSNASHFVNHGSVSTVIGKKYRFTFESTSSSLTTNQCAIYDGTNFIYKAPFTVGKIVTVDFVASSLLTTIYLLSDSGSTGTATFDNVAIYPINNDGSVDISGATPITNSRNYLNAIVYADAGGQPTYVEQLPKTRYEDIVKANEFQGKNACTAWVNFDGTTTPPTIRDSFNVSAVIRTATGVYDIYFKESMDNVSYDVSGTAQAGDARILAPVSVQLNKCGVASTYFLNLTGSTSGGNSSVVHVQIFGGKN